MMPNDTYHLEWNNHIPNIKDLLDTMYSHQNLVDVTISCHDGVLKAHKIILSACSPYFESVFRENPCKHPVLILKGISVREMQAILKFMYKGSVDIREDELVSLVSTAHEFKVKGFAYDIGNNTQCSRINENENNESAERNKRKNTAEVLEETELLYGNKKKARASGTDEHLVKDKENLRREPFCNNDNTTDMPVIINSHSLKGSFNESHSSDVDGLQGNDSADVHDSKEGIVQLPSVASEDSLEGRTSTPYARETRFKGRKRVAVGIRPLNRTRSVEKREQDLKRDNELKSACGILKKYKSNTGVFKNVPPTSSSATENGKRTNVEKSAKQVIERRTSEGYLDDNSGVVSVIPDIEIKEESEEATSLFCISALQEEGRLNERTDEEPDEKGEDAVCPYCYLDCHKVADLKKHLRTHTGEKPHECDFCDLAFARASHLARHRRVHTGERPFNCPSCGRRFSRQDKLKQHVKRHHLVTDVTKQSVLRVGVLPRRGRGRPRKIRDTPTSVELASGDGSAPNFMSLPAETSNVSLPFGDTSYLSSLSLGQQRYNDLTISPVAGTSQSAHPEDLLKSVRQLGECTIQAFSGRSE